MVRRVAFPFLTINEESISAGPWTISLDGGPFHDVGQWLMNWDYSSRIVVRRTLRLNWLKAAEQLEIEVSELAMSALVTVGTGLGTLPQSQYYLAPQVITESCPEVVVECVPNSTKLSQRLHLTTSIALTALAANRSALSPAVAGSKLWSDVVDLRLEGEEPRFPIEIVSFAAMLGSNAAAAKAPWFLQWNPGDPNRDFHGAVRLFLNEDLPDIVERIQSGDALLIQAMLGDVISQLVEKTLSNDDEVNDLRSCDPGSIGATVMTWIELAWPGEALSAIRSNFDYHPGRMRAAVLAVADVGSMEGE